MTSLSKSISISELNKAKVLIKEATEKYEALLAQHVETYYQDPVSLQTRKEMVFELLSESAVQVSAECKIQHPSEQDVLEEIFKNYCS